MLTVPGNVISYSLHSRRGIVQEVVISLIGLFLFPQGQYLFQHQTAGRSGAVRRRRADIDVPAISFELLYTYQHQRDDKNQLQDTDSHPVDPNTVDGSVSFCGGQKTDHDWNKT